MTGRRYHDFVIFTDDAETEADGTLKRFSVRVFQSPAGEGERKEQVTISDYDDLKVKRDKLGRRELDLDEQIALGQRLAELLLPPYSRQLYLRSLSELAPREGLRLRLRLLGQLAHLPWEYMVLQDTDSEPNASSFLALDPRVSLVRHEAMAIPPQRMPPGDTRRIFIAMATPGPYDKYDLLEDLPEEQRLIKEALSEVEGTEVRCLPDYGDKTEWERIPGARLEQIQAAIRKFDQVDIFHFSGHGDFETEMGDRFATFEGRGSIILANEDNMAVQVQGDRLAEMLRERGIRLVTLGACKTGKTDVYDAFSSVAAALLVGRIPCVLAMQFSIYSSLAAIFMAAVYEALVDGRTIDEAVFVGRAAIRARSHGNRTDARDWGTPVLYSRVPGGHIFPPIQDEHARQQAQQRIESRSSLHQTWWEWMDHKATVSESQLRYLAGAGESLELSPVQILLLLRSAVVEDMPAEPWLAHLRQQAGTLMTRLDVPSDVDSSAVDSAAYREERQVLGLDEAPHSERPRGVGAAAWTAVCHPDEVTRQTAALALTAIPPVPEEGLERLDRALSSLGPPWKRFARKMELRGALADGDPEIESVNASLPPLDRFGIWFWRAGRRARRQGDRIRALVFGAALGAGLALGTLRGLQGIFAGPLFMTRFAISLFWGAILGAVVGLGVGLAKPVLVKRSEVKGGTPPFWRAPLHPGRLPDLMGVLLGTLFFGIAHIAVAWFNGISLSERAIIIATGTLTGFGVNLALYGQPKIGRGQNTPGWLLRLAVAALPAILAQWLVITAGFEWPATAVTRTGEVLRDYFGRYENIYFLIDRSLNTFSYLDAALFGVLVTIGIAIGWQILEKPAPGSPVSEEGSGD